MVPLSILETGRLMNSQLMGRALTSVPMRVLVSIVISTLLFCSFVCCIAAGLTGSSSAVAKEGVTLFMSDSTNVLSPGWSMSEALVEKNIIDRVTSFNGKGRIITTMFASNLFRVGTMKKAAEAAGRKLCFIGTSLHAYLEAAHR